MSKKIKAGALALICSLSVICSMIVMITAALSTSVNNDFSLNYTPVNGIELNMSGQEFSTFLKSNCGSELIIGVFTDYYNANGDYSFKSAGGGIFSFVKHIRSNFLI